MLRAFLLWPLLCPFALVSQNLDLNRDTLITPYDSLALSDTSIIDPGSFQAFLARNSTEISHCFSINGKQIYWKSTNCQIAYQDEAVKFNYRVLHFDLTAPYNHLDTLQLDPLLGEQETYIGFDFSPFEDELERQSYRNLDYSGSFSRGLTFGNNQSLVLNSNFNLQMAGTLGEDINIVAAISDENIPIQPEGNTRQIQEFDRVFIELSKDQHRLLAGDLDLQNSSGHFMRYHKKLQGLNYQFRDKVGEGILQTEIGASISQGKFARQEVSVSEGNQGPYRLQGSSGERFIIVLAGTESVYLDGRKLNRGLENDYIIDYNTAEIIFTYNTLITKDSRIIVEFEFVDQNYSRSLLTLNSTYQTEKTEIFLNFYNEQDSRSPSGLQDLTANDIEVLEEAGDDLDALFRNTIRPVEEDFDPNRIQYELKPFEWTIGGRDTLFQILEVTNDPQANLFTAQFSDLGQGNGNYVRKTDGRNGRVYEFVPPDSISGAPRGRFEPVSRLTAPEKQQMTSVGIHQRFSTQTYLGAEVSISNFDRNRFSEIDNSNNAGLATAINFGTSRELSKDSIPWRISNEIQYELTNSHFRVLNPYRNAEFERDWNYGVQMPLVEHFTSGIIEIEKGENFGTSYEFSGLFREEEYTGTRNILQIRANFWNTSIAATANRVTTKSGDRETSFLRPSLEVRKELEFFKGAHIGYQFKMEENKFSEADTDSLSAASFEFKSNQFYLEQNTGSQLSWRLSYTQRTDDKPVQGDFERFTNSQQWGLSGNFTPFENHEIKLSSELRQLKVTEQGANDFQPKRTFLSRLEYNGSILDGALRYGNTYEAGSGQEPKVEFEYREVSPGEGQYQWVDLNEDGIQQINEYFLTPNPEERTFIRLPIVTDEFISVNTISLNQNVNWDPRNLDWGDSQLAVFAKRFSLVSNLRVQRKTSEQDRNIALNPWKFQTADTSLVSMNLGLRNTIFFNRGNPVYDIQLSQLHNATTNEQVTGSESRTNSEWALRSRWNASRNFTQIFEAKTTSTQGLSEGFLTNNFKIDGWAIKAESSYLFSTQTRLRGSYSFESRSNDADFGSEKGSFHEISSELSIRDKASSVIQARLSYTNANTDGPQNSPASIIILSGLSPGNNFQITLTFEKRLTDNLQISIQYNGRKPGENPVVHTGGINMTATF